MQSQKYVFIFCFFYTCSFDFTLIVFNIQFGLYDSCQVLDYDVQSLLLKLWLSYDVPVCILPMVRQVKVVFISLFRL